MTAPTGLARVTISAPQRRIDVAVPEHVPVAELLPELLRHAGEGLADDGEQHGGWLLRRTGGEPLANARGLQQQGIHDGEILHLVPARVQWPELEYDDVVETIAAGARRIGTGWHAGATRVASLVGAGPALAVALLGILATDLGPKWTVLLAVAALLLIAGVTMSRAYGEGGPGAALAGYALPYAFAGGALLVGDGAGRLLVGSMVLLLAAVLGGVGVGTALVIFVAGATVALFGVAGALLAFGLPADGAAAIVLAVLACGVGALPLLAIRLGKLPLPAVTLPAVPAPAEDPDGSSGRGAARGLPERAAVLAAVRRTSDMLTGMLCGHALAAAATGALLLRDGGLAARLLVAIAGTVLLLRARLFSAVRQRVPLLAAGLAALATVLAALVLRPLRLGVSDATLRPGAVVAAGPGWVLGVIIVVVVLAIVVVAAGTVYSRRPPTPYVGRAADLFDMALVVSVVPVACAVLDLYAKVATIIR